MSDNKGMTDDEARAFHSYFVTSFMGFHRRGDRRARDGLHVASVALSHST
jgi:hypothetical protein